MKCWICSEELSEIKLDDNMKIKPCPKCLEVVRDTLEEYDDLNLSDFEEDIEKMNTNKSSHSGFGEFETPKFMTSSRG